MSGSQKSNTLPFSEQMPLSENSEVKKSQSYEEEMFYRNCRAAYLAVFKSSLENIESKEQLCLVLQQAGQNPSQKTVSKYWTLQTTTMNFDDFCFILKQEKLIKETELLEAFSKIDGNNDGYILHCELYKILETRGEKMSLDELNAISRLPEVNNDGKFDYYKFCHLYTTTREQCLKNALEKLEVNNKLKLHQFGSQTAILSEMISPNSESLLSKEKETKRSSMQKRGDHNNSLQYSSAPSCKQSVSSTISMDARSNKNSKFIEANEAKEWQSAQSKGCFFIQDNGEIISHKYKLFLSQKSTVCITIQPIKLSQMEGKYPTWLAVDTALYIFKENETDKNIQLVRFTELRNKKAFGWRGELEAGIYWIIPFTTGCRFRKVKKQIEEVQLVYRDGNGDLIFTKELRATLSQIFEMIDLDSNGFLSLEEYNFFEMRTSGEKCDEEAWAACKEMVDMKNSELTKKGFMDLNNMEVSEKVEDLRSLWLTLSSMGYNKAMELTEACPFSIHICAEKCRPRIKPVCLETGGEQLKNLICLSVVNKGDAKPMNLSENIIIHTYKSNNRITSVIENKSESKPVIYVNNKQSKNCVNNRGLDTFAIEIAPNSMMVCQHVTPLNEKEEWIYSCVYSILS
ncbi:EF-hand calcium-binding domain-containing protein 7 isoform X1 [Python bivittatus]|uniref:EF-hand calcium-binding domain-containing protein 7 n=1 Tax=Python bivittatus TaxID=176946 RepID=A0A9F2QA85_PYTBI|nr:EF-hand calcium-binding domain-containing protein 7 isoform X1 [Python bivittatus]